MIFEGVGIEVVYVGVDISPDQFVEAVREHQPNFIGLSTLLTTTLAQMPAVIEALTVAGLRGDLKVIVGGAPVSQDLPTRLGLRDMPEMRP